VYRLLDVAVRIVARDLIAGLTHTKGKAAIQPTPVRPTDQMAPRRARIAFISGPRRRLMA
jgi:hypothetical protein